MRVAARAALTVLLAAASLGIAAPVASAAVPSLEFSVDGGATWNASPPAALFDPTFRFVPGDTISRTILFRSTRAEATAVIVTLDDVAVSEAPLGEALSVSARDADGNGIDSTRIASLQDCQPIVPVRVVAAGEPLSVTLTIEVSTSLTALVAQGSMSTSRIQIGLTDPGNVPALEGCAPDAAVIPVAAPPTAATSTPTATPTPEAGGTDPDVDPETGLARTGLDTWRRAVVVAVTAIGAGLLLILARRRRPER